MSNNPDRSLHGVRLFLLLAVFFVSSEVASASPLLGSATSSMFEGYIDTATGKVFVFEEPVPDGNGTTSSAVLPETEEGGDSVEEKELPRIAIIIDDMGHHRKMGSALLDLDLNLTFSFLPHAPFTAAHEKRAWEMGRDILVHMPMEPRDSMWDPGPGALYLNDPADKILLTVEENLTLVPHAIGVNNHMGSRFTTDRQAMHTMLTVLKNKGLFFLDSLTASESVAADEARAMGIRTARRHIFLDNSQNQEDICRQIKRLVAYARKFGRAIGIGHPNWATVSALKSCRDLLRDQVQIVGIHELVK